MLHDGQHKKILTSPSGWALANLWYDTCPRMPERGSPFETLLMLVQLQRAKAALYSTRALVQSTLPEGKAADAAIKAFQTYCDLQLPFLERAANADVEEAKALLEQFVRHPLSFPIAPVIAAKAARVNRRHRTRQMAATRQPTPPR